MKRMECWRGNVLVYSQCIQERVTNVPTCRRTHDDARRTPKQGTQDGKDGIVSMTLLPVLGFVFVNNDHNVQTDQPIWSQLELMSQYAGDLSMRQSRMMWP